MLEKIGVHVYVLRKHATSTDVLLVQTASGLAAGRWSPLAGAIDDDETEAEAALRQVSEATGLEPERVYATAILCDAGEAALGRPGRMGIFVAYVAPRADPELGTTYDGHAWVPMDRAGERLPEGEPRALLRSVEEQFCKRSPDEALRIA